MKKTIITLALAVSLFAADGVLAVRPVGNCDRGNPSPTARVVRDCVLDNIGKGHLKFTTRQIQWEDALLSGLGSFRPYQAGNGLLGAKFEGVEYDWRTAGKELADLWIVKLEQCQAITESGCRITSKVAPPIDLATPDTVEFAASLQNMNDYMDLALTGKLGEALEQAKEPITVEIPPTVRPNEPIGINRYGYIGLGVALIIIGALIFNIKKYDNRLRK